GARDREPQQVQVRRAEPRDAVDIVLHRDGDGGLGAERCAVGVATPADERGVVTAAQPVLRGKRTHADVRAIEKRQRAVRRLGVLAAVDVAGTDQSRSLDLEAQRVMPGGRRGAEFRADALILVQRDDAGELRAARALLAVAVPGDEAIWVGAQSQAR